MKKISPISFNTKIYVAGHRGMVGSALVRQLLAQGYSNLVLRTSDELNLTRQAEVELFFEAEQPEIVFLAAGKVGGIQANDSYRGDFYYQNAMIQNNVIHSAYKAVVKRLLFMGSSCIYPKQATQPLREEYLLTGLLEPTNQPYAIAKISGIEMCWSYNRQFSTKYLTIVPSNLYGCGDSYHPENSHVIPALMRRIYQSKLNNEPIILVWGSGKPLREFLYIEDMASACIHIMNLDDSDYNSLLSPDRPPMINLGSGEEISISHLAESICKVVGCRGKIVFDLTKPDGMMRKLLDISLITSLGWKPRVKFQEGLALTYKDFLEQSSK